MRIRLANFGSLGLSRFFGASLVSARSVAEKNVRATLHGSHRLGDLWNELLLAPQHGRLFLVESAQQARHAFTANDGVEFGPFGDD